MAAPRDVPFSCTCGTLKGTLRGVSPRSGTHAVCHCGDCRAAGLIAGAPPPAPATVDLFQTSPDLINFDAGEGKLAVMSFGENNLLRWYAACCGAPLFNTLRNPKIAFASIFTDRLADPSAVGPVKAQAFMPAAGGKQKHEGLLGFAVGAFSRIAAARLSGRWKDTPFFDPGTLKPVREVRIIDKATRAAAKATLR